jgi:hypothetical protein
MGRCPFLLTIAAWIRGRHREPPAGRPRKNKTTFSFTQYGEVTPMELSIIAIIAAAAVLLLQIVSLVQMAGIRKLIRLQRDVRPMPPQQHSDRFDKRGQDFRRHERRPFPDQRPQPQPQQPAVTQIDPVEKSLRDINLRLKSAEREQESARRRIQENFPRGDHSRGRDDRDQRGGRDRDHRRNNRRDGWQDRNRSGGFQQQSLQPQAGQQQPRNELFPEKKTIEIPPAGIPMPAPQTDTVAPQDAGVSDSGSGETFQHGRKIIVNRRPLNDDVSAETRAGSTSAENTPAHEPQASADQAAPSFPAVHAEEETRIAGPGPDVNPDAPIKFGRR